MKNISTKSHKRRTKYTVLLIPDTAELPSKELHSLPILVITILASFLAIVIICIGIVIYQQGLILQSSYVNSQKDATINANEEQISALEAKIETLSSNIISMNQLISDANNLREQAENDYKALAEEVYELCKPTGCPVTGTATVAEDHNTMTSDYIVLFDTYEGADVIATGAGTILDIYSSGNTDTEATEGKPNTQVGDENFKYVIAIDHGEGYISYYYSNEHPLVEKAAKVDKATPLFHIGTNGSHIGYQLKKDDSFINPWDMIEIYG